MSNYFQYEDKYGNVAYLTDRGNGNVSFGVCGSTDGIPRSASVPRAALMEWLNGGKPETQTAQTAFVVTDEMAEAAADAGIQPGEFRLAYRGEADRKRLVRIARDMLTAALAAGQVPVWEPCQREDIRKGDRYRFEVDHGSVGEGTATLDFNEKARNNERWFRIPAPTPAVEWPEEPGPYLVTWMDDEGRVTEGAWMLGDGDVLDDLKGQCLFKEDIGFVFTLLSVKRGGVVEHDG